jgi:hypothetical protein
VQDQGGVRDPAARRDIVATTVGEFGLLREDGAVADGATVVAFCRWRNALPALLTLQVSEQ